METNVRDTLKERGNVYGDYRGGVQLRTDIMNLIKDRFKEVQGTDMPEEYSSLFTDVLGKLSRLAVSPGHIDSWHDVAGYAVLVEDILKGDEDEK